MSTIPDLVLRYEGRHAVETGRARELRSRARLSQNELAEAVGVSGAAVARWEAGDRLPRGVNAERLGQLLRDLEQAVLPS